MTAEGTPTTVLGRRRLLGALALASASLAVAACATPVAPRWTFAPAPRPSGGALVIRIVAENLAFDLAELSVPANTPFRIEFDHRDVNIPHNVAIYESGPDGPGLFRGEIFSGARVVVYNVPGLPRGTHHFTCDPHPYMAGTVLVA